MNNFTKNAKKTLQLKIVEFWKNKKHIINFFVVSLLTVLILFNSGSAAKNYFSSSFQITVIYVVIVAVLFIVFIRNFNLKRRIKSKNGKSLVFIYSLALFLLIILSFLFNKEKMYNANTYIVMALTIIISIFVVYLLEFKKFIQYFSKTIFIISIIALFFWLAHTVFGLKYFSSSIYYHESANVYVENHFFVYFRLEYLNVDHYRNTRVMSIFWEPSIYGTFLLLVLINNIFVEDKPILRIDNILFVLMIFLTQSTSAIILLVPLVVAVVLKFIKQTKIKSIVFFSFLTIVVMVFVFKDAVLSLLIKIAPAIFNKISFSDGSFVTRLKSPIYFFEVFKASPFWGNGGKTAIDIYNGITPTEITSATFTFGYLMAAFGIFGLVYSSGLIISLFNTTVFKGYERILIGVTLLLIINKENVSANLLVSIYLFYLISETNPKIDRSILNG